MADRRTRKHRRAIKAIHKSRSGRTGKVRSSQLKGLRHHRPDGGDDAG
jgi:hypothetical protein